jgi:putative RecB family exonuclease
MTGGALAAGPAPGPGTASATAPAAAPDVVAVPVEASAAVPEIVVPQQRRRPALSPSRAGDFKQCPLLYRFRVVDRLPERPTPAQLRGTVVHAVLERLFALPAPERVPERAHALVDGVLAELAEADRELLADGDEAAARDRVARLLGSYFAMEDPRRLEPEACELFLETELASGVLLRGYVDRLDVAPTGEIRIVDYKTGSAPREVFEGKALFQMKFYALVLLRTRGVLPRQLRLMYLADGESLSYSPDADELGRFERTLDAIWTAVLRAAETGDFRPSRSRMCGWCSHQAVCPSFGGTPPDYPGWPADPDPADPDRADPERATTTETSRERAE